MEEPASGGTCGTFHAAGCAPDHSWPPLHVHEKWLRRRELNDLAAGQQFIEPQINCCRQFLLIRKECREAIRRKFGVGIIATSNLANMKTECGANLSILFAKTGSNQLRDRNVF